MNIIRTINQNKLQIIIVIIAIIIVIGIIQTLNYFAKISNQEPNNSIANGNTTISEEDRTLSPAISGSNTKTENAENYKKAIENFINLCNNQKPEQAYEMLSSECKETMFSNYQLFYNNYYRKNFAGAKTCTIQNWTDSIFKVDLKDDVLSTGGASKSNIQDFITVVNSKDQYKLNINSYIGRKIINNETKSGNVTFRVLKKDVNMKYETYYIEVENNEDTDILLDNLDTAGTIYLQDKKQVKYSYINEGITKELLRVKSKCKVQIAIKFSDSYISNRELTSIVFSKAQIENADSTTKEIKFEIKL